jgi:hypothetical protein
LGAASQVSDTEPLFVREDSEIRGEDSDDAGQVDAEDLATANSEAAVEVVDAVRSSVTAFSEEDYKVLATVQYRAT